MKQLFLSFGLMCLATSLSAATVNIVASESGADVVLTGSGSLDLTNATKIRDDVTIPNNTNTDRFTFGVDHTVVDVYQFTSASYTRLSAFDTDMLSSGDGFGYQGSFGGALIPTISVSSDYVSGDTLAFEWRIESTSIAALGLNFGTLYAYEGGTVELSSAAVPLPASFLLLGLGMSGLLAFGRRKS